MDLAILFEKKKMTCLRTAVTILFGLVRLFYCKSNTRSTRWRYTKRKGKKKKKKWNALEQRGVSSDWPSSTRGPPPPTTSTITTTARSAAGRTALHSRETPVLVGPYAKRTRRARELRGGPRVRGCGLPPHCFVVWVPRPHYRVRLAGPPRNHWTHLQVNKLTRKWALLYALLLAAVVAVVVIVVAFSSREKRSRRPYLNALQV